MADGQPIGAHEATRVERLSTEQGSECGSGSGSVSEVGAGSLQPNAFTNLTACDLKVLNVCADETPTQEPEHAVCDVDSGNNSVNGLRLAERNCAHGLPCSLTRTLKTVNGLRRDPRWTSQYRRWASKTQPRLLEGHTPLFNPLRTHAGWREGWKQRQMTRLASS